MGVLTLAAFILGFTIPLEGWWLSAHPPVTSEAPPGRMSAGTALAFVCLGIALLLLSSSRESARIPRSVLALVTLLLGGFALVGYLFGVDALYSLSVHGAMAIPTGISFVLLAAGVLSARPDDGPMRVIASPRAGGIVARRLLPVVVLVFPMIGWLRWQGEKAGFYDGSVGTALYLIATLVLFSTVILAIASRLEATDAARHDALDARRGNEARLSGIIGSAMDAIITIDASQRITVFNAAAERMFGYPAAEVLGLSLDRLIPARFRAAHGDHVRAFGRTNVTRRAMGELGAIYGLRSSGEEFPIEASISQVELAGERIFTVILRDIGERLRTETRLRDAQESLRLSERRLAGIIGSAMDAIITVDEDQRITLFNSAAERMFGRRADYMQGRSLDELIPQRFREKHPEHVRSFGRTNVTRRSMGELGAIYGLRAGGGEFPIEASISQVQVGDSRHFTVILRDITERRAAEESLRRGADRAALLAELAGSMAAVVDDYQDLLRLIVRRTSEQIGEFCAIHLLTADGAAFDTPALHHADPLLRDRLLEILAREPPRPTEGLAAQVLQTGKPFFREGTTPEELRELVPQWALLEALPVRGVIYAALRSRGETIGTLALFRTQGRPPYTEDDLRLVAEIADRAALAITSARLFADMESRVAQRTLELDARNRELETFSYSVSHDLKAPLRGIDGYSRLLLRDHAERLDGDGRAFLENVRSAAQHMSRLIDDLLAYSRLERRVLKASRVSPRSIVDDLLAERRQDLEARRLVVGVNVPEVEIAADPQGLALALRNLLDNALKFTKESASPMVEIGGRIEDGKCVLWVRDNGVGFDMRFHDRIFEIFQRLQRAEEYPGTGVGLAMVRKAMERMGGRAWAESAPAQGSTFYLEVPR
jgi:PAS domain S-box-containing protein